MGGSTSSSKGGPAMRGWDRHLDGYQEYAGRGRSAGMESGPLFWALAEASAAAAAARAGGRRGVGAVSADAQQLQVEVEGVWDAAHSEVCSSRPRRSLEDVNLSRERHESERPTSAITRSPIEIDRSGRQEESLDGFPRARRDRYPARFDDRSHPDRRPPPGQGRRIANGGSRRTPESCRPISLAASTPRRGAPGQMRPGTQNRRDRLRLSDEIPLRIVEAEIPEEARRFLVRHELRHGLLA